MTPTVRTFAPCGAMIEETFDPNAVPASAKTTAAAKLRLIEAIMRNGSKFRVLDLACSHRRTPEKHN